MKTIASLLLLCAVCCFGIPPAMSQTEGLPRVSVNGNQFVTAGGTPIVFRGLNASDPDRLAAAGQWNASYFAEIKAWGANIVRFPVHPSRWRARGQAYYLELLDEGIRLAAEQDLYVIIDWHSIGNLRTQLYQRDTYDTTLKETFEFWRTIAERYGDNTTVAFYELFNEPTTQQGRLGSCTWAQWKTLMEEVIGIIRANGGQGVPLVAGFNWAYDLTPVREQPIAADGIAYVSHPYPQKRPKPWEAQWTEDWGFVKEKYPLMLTEIGFAGEEEPGAHIPVISDESYGDAITNYCDAAGISYVVWVFDPRWAPALFTDWSFKELTRQGHFFKQKLQGY